MQNNSKDSEEELQKLIELEDTANKNCLIRVVAGSHAYGTNIPSSDWDERSIFADEMSRIVLPFDKVEQVKYREDDKVAYELSKYMPLLLSQNPNVIEILWTDPKDVLYKSDLGQLLIDHRSSFLSIDVKESYVGYALKQLKRIKGHNKWINSPQPEREPERMDFLSVIWNFTEDRENNKKVPLEGYIAINVGDHNYSLWKAERLNLPSNCSWIDKRGNPNPMDKSKFHQLNKNRISPDLIVKVNDDLFDSHHTNWKLYWKWKKERNESRSVLEEKYGYDTKHAMHLIRLLRSGVDILQYGTVPVKRADADYLKDIRNGIYTYEEIVKESEKLTKQVEEISQKSSLPKEPNYALAKEIMLEIYMKQWNLTPQDVKKLKL